MASNLTVTLIAGAAVIGGAVLGGAAQALVSWRQRFHDRQERRRTIKLETYRKLLNHFAGITHVISEAVPLDDAEQSALLRRWSKEYDLLRADVNLVGPDHIRGEADEVQAAFGKMTEETQRAANSGLRYDVYEHTRAQFEEYVWPAIKQLADEMAKDLDLR